MADESNIKTPQELNASFGRKDSKDSAVKTPGQLRSTFGRMDKSKPEPPSEEPPKRDEKQQEEAPPVIDVRQDLLRAETQEDDIARIDRALAIVNGRVSEVEAEVESARDTVNSSSNKVVGIERDVDILKDSLDGSRGADDTVTVTREPDGALVIDASPDPYPFELMVDPDDQKNVAIRGGLADVITFPSSTISVVNLPISTGNFTGGGDELDEVWTCTTSLGANETRWVYLSVDGTGGSGHITLADTIGAYITADGASRPEEGVAPFLSYLPGSIKVLGKVETDSNGIVDVTPEWTGGCLKLYCIIPDHIDSFSSPTSSSLWFDAFGRLGIYNLAGQDNGKSLYAINDGANNMSIGYEYPNTIDGNATGVSAVRNNIPYNLATDGTGQYIQFSLLDYKCGDQVGAGHPPGHSELSDNGSGTPIDIWTMVDDYVTSGTFSHPHTQHTFTNDDHIGTGDDRYLRTDGVAARNNMSGVLGDNAATPKNSVAPNARILYDTDGTTTSVSWVDAVLGKTAVGNWHTTSTDTSDSSISGNSLYSLGGVGATGVIYGTGGLKIVNNGVTTQIMGASSYGLTTTGDINAALGYYYNATPGVSITNWFGGGILTGGSIVEIDFDDLQSGDKLLVYR